MATRIYFKGTKLQVKLKVRQLTKMLTGRAADYNNIARAFQATVGAAMLKTIKEAYLVKSKGGTDEMGIHWPPLTQRYLAYGRSFDKGEQASLKKIQGLRKGHHRGPGGFGLLSYSQKQRWNQIFHAMVNKFSLSKPMSEAKAIAAKIAWSVLKKEGAKTKLEVYGNRTVDILYDTGKLFNSICDGQLEGATYTKPTTDGGQDQIFELTLGRITIGSKVKYAGAHQNGIPGKLPRRQFLPDSGTQVPRAWWEQWLTAGAKSLEERAQTLFTRTTP